MSGERLFTTVAAAREIEAAVSPDDIARLARRGLVPALRVGRRWLLTAAAVRQAETLLGGGPAAPRRTELVLVGSTGAWPLNPRKGRHDEAR
jgi:hypothetical protein